MIGRCPFSGEILRAWKVCYRSISQRWVVYQLPFFHWMKQMINIFAYRKELSIFYSNLGSAQVWSSCRWLWSQPGIWCAGASSEWLKWFWLDLILLACFGRSPSHKIEIGNEGLEDDGSSKNKPCLLITTCEWVKVSWARRFRAGTLFSFRSAILISSRFGTLTIHFRIAQLALTGRFLFKTSPINDGFNGMSIYKFAFFSAGHLWGHRRVYAIQQNQQNQQL